MTSIHHGFLAALLALAPLPAAALSLQVTGVTIDPAGTVACEHSASDCISEAIFALDSATGSPTSTIDTDTTNGTIRLGTLRYTNPNAAPGEWASVEFTDYALFHFGILVVTGSPQGALEVEFQPGSFAGAAFGTPLVVLDSQGSTLIDSSLPIMQIGLFEDFGCSLTGGVGQCSFDFVGPVLTSFQPFVSYEFRQRVVLDVRLPEPGAAWLLAAAAGFGMQRRRRYGRTS